MYVDRTINPIESDSLNNNPGKMGRYPESFHDILMRTINDRSNSHPYKLELTGLLMPCYHQLQRHTFRFKLATEAREYFLAMNTKLTEAAKNVAWEVVTVRGYLDYENNVFNVERLIFTNTEDPLQIPANFREPIDLETFERIIHQRGKLEPAIDDLAS